MIWFILIYVVLAVALAHTKFDEADEFTAGDLLASLLWPLVLLGGIIEWLDNYVIWERR